MGRICYHPCETACNRAQLDEAVGINAIERFLGDLAIEQGWALPPPGPDTGKRVLVVGAGPAGLSAAYHLRRFGHDVHLVDSAPRLGGMMRYGIPAYRLPRAVLDAEIARDRRPRRRGELDHAVNDIEAERREGGFDAVFLGVGAQLAERVEIPPATPPASSTLSPSSTGLPTRTRPSSDAASSSTAAEIPRLTPRAPRAASARPTPRSSIAATASACRRMATSSRNLSRRALRCDGSRQSARFEGDHLTLEKMRLNEDGFPEPTGEFEELGADALVLALGQDTDLSLLGSDPHITIEDGVMAVSPAMMAAANGIFAGGDAVPSARTATVAIGHGKRAARGIDAFLSGNELLDTPRHELANFGHLNTWYYADAPRTRRPELERARRQSTFEEVVGGLTEETALFEARRCLSCGNCFECDNCFGVCPDNAVIKLGQSQRYEFDYDFCKGCGICVQECPCGAIKMVPEQI